MIKRIVCILLILVLLPACQITNRDGEKNQQETLGAGQINKAVEIAPLEPVGNEEYPEIPPLEPVGEETYPEIPPLEPVGEETYPEIPPLEPVGEETYPEIPPLEPVGEETYPEIPPLEPVGEETYPEIPPLKPVGGEPAQTKPAQVPKPSQKPVNADWILNVDDNVTLTIEDMKYHVNLYVSMSKSGGTDVTGTYTGKILYTSTVDEAELAKLLEDDTDLILDSGVFNFTMEAVSASLDVVKYDSKKYAAQTKEAPVKADYMAVSVIDIRMRQQAHLSAHDTDGGTGEGWTPDMDITRPIEVRFLITGGKVKAYIGNNPGGEAFSGMVTGTPK